MNEEVPIKKLIICKKCDTIHKKRSLEVGSVAKCDECKSILYRRHKNLLDYGLALGISAFIFFILSNMFPIVTISLKGSYEDITLLSVLFSLFRDGYYLVGIFCSMVIFIFPFFLLVVYIWIMWLMRNKKDEHLAHRLLIILSKLLPWNMTEIFLISIFVALVKLIGYAQIYLGTSLWALIVFVGLDLYLAKSISIDELWRAKRRVYRGESV